MSRWLCDRSSWIFDLDGTLTLPVHDFAYIRQELAIPDDADILEHLDTLPHTEAKRHHERLEQIERELAERAAAAPGLLELLGRLEQAGARLGILTRNSREIALLTLEAIGARHYFAAAHVVGRGEAPPKPDPAGLLHLLGQWSGSAANAVMVGDYLFDLQAGRAAGTATIHVARPDGQRWPEESDLMVDDLEELAGLLAEEAA